MESTPRESQVSTQAESSPGVMPSASHTDCSVASRPCESRESSTRSSGAVASFRCFETLEGTRNQASPCES